MPTPPKASNKYAFQRKWTAKLVADGFVPVSNFFLENYHRLKPYDLTYGEAMFVIHLMQHKWDVAAPFPAYKTIAERMHVSVKSARRYAASLERKAYLQRIVRVGQTNRFKLDGLMAALDQLKDKQVAKDKRKKEVVDDE